MAADGCELSASESTIYIKLLRTETHIKQRHVLISGWNWSRRSWEPGPCFPNPSGSVFANSVLMTF